MFSKIASLFQSEKQKFKTSLKKEKKRLYLREMPKYIKKKKKSRKSYNNFSRIHIQKPTLLIGILVIIGWLIWLIFFLFNGNYFSIQKIKITSNDTLSNVSFAYKSIDSFRWKNIFFTNTSSIRETLKKKQKNIINVSIVKNIPHWIKITLESYPALFTLTHNEKDFFITSNGIAVPSDNGWNSSRELTHIRLLSKNTNSSNAIHYQKIISPLTLNKIFFLTEYIKRNIITLNIKKVLYYTDEREIHIITSKKTRLIFDLTWDIMNQITSYNIMRDKLPKEHFYYIDLRIKNKVFYCTYSTEYNCKQNITNIYGKIHQI